MFIRYGKSWRPYRYRCPEARGGPYRIRGLAAPTILRREMSASTILFCVRVAAEYCSMQGMVPGTVVLTCEPCLAFLRTSSGSYRTGVPGRMAPIDSECAGRRRAVSRVPMSPGRRDAGSESEVGLGAGFRSRPSGDSWSPNRALRSDRWAEVADERALLFLGLAFRSVAGPPLCHVVFRLLGRALAWKPVPEGPRVYEPDK